MYFSDKEKQKMWTQTTDNLKYKIWAHRPSIKGTDPLFIVIKTIIIIITDFKSGIFHGRHCYKVLSLMSKMIEMKSHVVSWKGSKKCNFYCAALFSGYKSQRRNGNSDDKVLMIALCYTGASVFRMVDSLTPFCDSISAFECRSARLTESRSLGYLSRWSNTDTRFRERIFESLGSRWKRPNCLACRSP